MMVPILVLVFQGFILGGYVLVSRFVMIFLRDKEELKKEKQEGVWIYDTELYNSIFITQNSKNVEPIELQFVWVNFLVKFSSLKTLKFEFE